MAATRTQVYLTEDQRRQIDDRIARDGHSLAWIIREALDQYLAGPATDRGAALDATFGALPGIAVPSRDEWDRYPAGPTALAITQRRQQRPARRRG
jgi:hypothetical protein